MLVHLIARPLTHVSHIPSGAVGQLADGLRAAGHSVIEDTWAIPSSDMAGSATAAAAELSARWSTHRPDVIHTIGLAATMAALEAEPGVPVVATFDEQPADTELEHELAQQVAAVVPLSRSERDRWRRRGVRTLWSGAFPFPMPVPDEDACAAVGGDVITLCAGPDLDRIIDSMPGWDGRLVVLARLTNRRHAAIRARALAHGVWERIDLRPGLRGRDREEAWARASLVVAGREGARHGGHVLEAAARGIPAVAMAAGAHLDHVVSRSTGLLVDPRCDQRTLGEAIAAMVDDPFWMRALGTSALVRMRASHAPEAAGRRLAGLYQDVLPDELPLPEPRVPVLRQVDPDGPDRMALAMDHLPLARQLAGWYSGRGQSREDLVQVASLGLVRAAERFDPAHGKEFHSFAIPTILGELRKHFRDHAWAVRVPRSLQETTLQVQRAAEQMRQSLGHDASPADLAKQLGLVEEEVLLALRTDGEARSSHSLDHPVGEDESVADLVGDVDPAIDLIELRHDVRQALARLPEREQRILLMRFYGERTQSEIAEQLGISQVHVSRVLSRTLAALRDHVLEDLPLPASWERELPRGAGAGTGPRRAGAMATAGTARGSEIPRPRRAS
jgi:RNA polymerase sigma-B factor